MAEKKLAQEREYIVPLRKDYIKTSRHKRAKRAVTYLKKFIAKHMRVPERDIKKVKLDKWLNHELWFRGIKKPPAKIKVKARREGELIKVELAEIPEAIKFKVEKERKIEQEDKKKAEEKKKEEEEKKPEEEKKEESKETKEEKEEKKEETEEKQEAVKEAGKIMAEQKHKEQKHQAKSGKEPQIQRKALQK